jgi:hypothetical protein
VKESEGMPRFTITGIKIDDYDLPVPHGLSELLNEAGAWGIPEKESTISDQYDRRVEKREDGSIVTVLTKKQK